MSLIRNTLPADFPKIVVLCGSTRFKSQYLQVQREEALKGHIVLSVSDFSRVDDGDLTVEQKQILDEVHKRKIDLADEVIVIDMQGYLGASTRDEILYAQKNDKVITYRHFYSEIEYEVKHTMGG